MTNITAVITDPDIKIILLKEGIRGRAGEKGDAGASGATGPVGPKGADGIIGVDGKSAYEIWLDNGNTGTINDFLATLKGAKGDPGTNGAEGTPGIVWKGTWNSATAYAIHDAVTYLGSSYLALTPHTNIDPVANPSTWTILAVKGADGLGAGDMLKTTYDTNNNGKVDTAEVAESVEWANVENKPESFTPSTHKASHSSGGTDAISPSDIGAIPDIPLVVQGDIIYRGSEGWSRLAAGTAGQVLKTQGASANPHWANESGGSGGSTTLAALTDVNIPAPTNDQVLSYNSTSSKWEAKDSAGGSVITPISLATGTDINTIRTPGEYYGYNWVNVPAHIGNADCFLKVIGTSSTKTIQIIYGMQQGYYIGESSRSYNSSWSGWTYSGGAIRVTNSDYDLINDPGHYFTFNNSHGPTEIDSNSSCLLIVYATYPTETTSPWRMQILMDLQGTGKMFFRSKTYTTWSASWTAIGISTLAALTDIDFTTAPTNNQILVYDSTASKWKPSSVLDGLEAAIAVINGV